MASAVYPPAIITIMSGGIDLSSLDVKAVLLDTAVYTYDAGHDMYSDLSGVVATETGALASKTIGVVGTGVFDAANGTVTAATGTHAEACATFIDRGGVATADNLLSFNELSSPVTPNGGDITLSWSESGIFSL
jgi:hypothetical protein